MLTFEADGGWRERGMGWALARTPRLAFSVTSGCPNSHTPSSSFSKKEFISPLFSHRSILILGLNNPLCVY